MGLRAFTVARCVYDKVSSYTLVLHTHDNTLRVSTFCFKTFSSGLKYRTSYAFMMTNVTSSESATLGSIKVAFFAIWKQSVEEFLSTHT